ncbi:MAG: 16S rRNA (cytosine(1402)-N(4))-methyltransferase RsmH [Patescibacteria group bacterium]|nr:16S rRNA (cytosine(1402)-N(4))-methyltransferase RsmH [Patescibacteria group bacterium]
MNKILHKPVLLNESIKFLKIKPNKNYLDCTLGSGGHAVEIIKKGGKLYGLDIDPEAIKRTTKRINQTCPNAFYKIKLGNFSKLKEHARDLKLTSVSGILMDLGLSSDQLENKKLGFSFQNDSPLDMRANPDLKVAAKDLINGLSKNELIKLFKKYGEEQYALSIANHIVLRRQQSPINTTLELVNLITKVKRKRGGIHQATKVFQALRIAVNDELNNLKTALPQAYDLLEEKGKLVVISFHSLEDRIVKNFIKEHKGLKNLTKKPITPNQEELTLNPRSRSAKLRAAFKI